MKAIDQLKNQRHQNDQQDEEHGPACLGMLQNDMEDNVADITAAVENLFQQFVEVLQYDHAHGAMIAIVEVAKQLQHQVVRVAFDLLELVVLRFDFFEVHPFAQFLHQRDYDVTRFLKH